MTYLLKVALRASKRISGHAAQSYYDEALKAGVVTGKTSDELAQGYYKHELPRLKAKNKRIAAENNIDLLDLTKRKHVDKYMAERSDSIISSFSEINGGGVVPKGEAKSALESMSGYYDTLGKAHGGGAMPHSAPLPGGGGIAAYNKNRGYFHAFNKNPGDISSKGGLNGNIYNTALKAEKRVRGSIAKKLMSMPKDERRTIMNEAATNTEILKSHEISEGIWRTKRMKSGAGSIHGSKVIRSQGIQVLSPHTAGTNVFSHVSPSVLIDEHIALANAPANVKNSFKDMRTGAGLFRDEASTISMLTDNKVNYGSYSKRGYKHISNSIRDAADRTTAIGRQVSFGLYDDKVRRGITVLKGGTPLTDITKNEIVKGVGALSTSAPSKRVLKKELSSIVNSAYKEFPGLESAMIASQVSNIKSTAAKIVPTSLDLATRYTPYRGKVNPEMFSNIARRLNNTAKSVLQSPLFKNNGQLISKGINTLKSNASSIAKLI